MVLSNLPLDASGSVQGKIGAKMWSQFEMEVGGWGVMLYCFLRLQPLGETETLRDLGVDL